MKIKCSDEVFGLDDKKLLVMGGNSFLEILNLNKKKMSWNLKAFGNYSAVCVGFY